MSNFPRISNQVLMIRNLSSFFIHSEINGLCSITNASEFLAIEEFKLTSLENWTWETLEKKVTVLSP